MSMKRFIEGESRFQSTLFPERLDDYIAEDNAVRVVDAFVEKLDLTGFRNGNLNLHFLHVNREKGRSCRTCHEVHAGNQAKHIRNDVPFGKAWMLPIDFTENRNGGTCVAGCHKPKDYNRVNPVAY